MSGSGACHARQRRSSSCEDSRNHQASKSGHQSSPFSRCQFREKYLLCVEQLQFKTEQSGANSQHKRYAASNAQIQIDARLGNYSVGR
jgi:hypothetical protein